MEEKKSRESKFNITWISIIVIFVGAIIYPIVFESAKIASENRLAYLKKVQNYQTNHYRQLPVITITPVSVLPEKNTIIDEPFHDKKVAEKHSKVLFEKDLQKGDYGQDVKRLQEYLNQNGFVVTKSGPGSSGFENQNFGPATEKALKAFQEAHADVLLTPFFMTEGSGVLDKNTRDFINS